MVKQSIFQTRYPWLYITAYATLAAVAVVEIVNVSTLGIRWMMLALLLIFGLVLTVYGMQDIGRSPNRSSNWQIHFYLAVQCAVVAGLLLLRRSDLVVDTPVKHALLIPMLYCILCVQAVLALPLRSASLWVVGMILINGSLLCTTFGLSDGLFGALPYTVGFIFSGAFSYGLNRAEAAQRESLTLLEELRHIYRQLQEYASKAETLAVSEERNRLAREMHDALGHRLTVAAVQLEGAQRLIDSHPERADKMVGTVRQQVLEALSELRRTVATLRTPLEEDLSLPKALARLADNFEEATGITIHPTLPEDIPHLPDTHRLGFYRMAQEALTNIQRHAQAKEAWLELTLKDGIASLLVKDNGIGLPSNAIRIGFGLRGLQERAAQLGGKLLLESGPGGGTQVCLNLPLPAEAAHG